MSLCPECGRGHVAKAGYCLSIECAGHVDDDDFPRTAPDDAKWNEAASIKSKATGRRKPRKPRKGALRSTELWYESRGETPPWKEDEGDHA